MENELLSFNNDAKPFSLSAFANKLIDLFVHSQHMPDMGGAYTNKYGNTEEDSSKHKKRPEPRDLRTQIERSMNTSMGLYLGYENTISFNIGSEFMETNFPYYHILQQAPTIRKKGKGTKKTKGSQMYEKDVGKRDYERVNWNGKTFTKEYSRNVRGGRLNLNKTSMHIDGQFLNMEQNQYLNMHYKYIDNILNLDVVDQLANYFGMKKVGAKSQASESTGLEEEYAMQSTYTTNLIDSINSFI